MRRFFLVLLFAGLLAACSRQVPAPVAVEKDEGDADPKLKPKPPVPVLVGDKVVGDHKDVDALVSSLTEPTQQERYDALLLDAFNALADRKYADALNSLETARAIQDTEQVRREIDKVKTVIAQQAAAERTARDIQTVLNEGKAEEAAKLGTQALQQFGGTDLADDLGKLKRQADAVAAPPMDNAAARLARFLAEARAARDDKNLRAAAIAYEQALQAGEDAEARKQYEEVRGALARYDDNRQRAAQLRRDPANLEDAVAALKAAQEAWDTPQVRQEIDECNFALEKRRERLSVADFEVRGEVGVPEAGRTIAEELLPAFKSRFDLVEREQLGKIVNELKLEATGVADDPTARQEVGRLARLRYLVVGSVTPLNGVTVQARLVEVRTGLIVQTARVSAPTVEQLLPRLRVLAKILMMTDDQKMAFEEGMAQQAVEIKPINVEEKLPPPPEVNDPPPPPVIAFAAQAPPLGARVGVVIEDFRRVPPPVVEVVVIREEPRRRLLALSLELGDNLFRRGRHREAQRHFELALTLTDNRREIDIRIERCRPFLPPPPPPPVVVVVPPPPPVIVVAPPPVFVAPPPPAPVVICAPPPPLRPRIVVFNFFLNCEPGLVPPAVGDWAADQFASHFIPAYEVVERGEVCWYMGRLGITMRDVLNDPSARCCLARALNVRFFVFGAIEQTHSFNVTTHMVDAESGARIGTGTIHVQDHNEMKLRMHELAKQVGAPNKEEQAKIAERGKEDEKKLNEARKLQKEGKFTQAAEVSRAALKESPNNVALQTVLHESEEQARKAALEQARKDEAARHDAELKAAVEKQRELAKKADLERLKAEQLAKTKDETTRRAEDAKKQRAAEQLRADAKKSLAQGNTAAAVQSLQSAAALKPSDDVFNDLAKAKAQAEKAARDKAAADQAKLAAERKKQEDDARKRVEDEKKQREADDLARRKAQEARDSDEAARLLTQAKEQLGKQQFDAALAAVEASRRLHASDESNKLLLQIQDQKTLAEAKKKGEQARLDAEKKLADENAKREKAAAEAKKNQDAYTAALKDAQKAMADKKYDQAIAKFDEADKLFHTDVVLTGRKQAVELRDREKAVAEADKRKKEEEDKRTARIKELQTAGQKALDAQKFDEAVKSFREASQLSPGNVDLLAAVSKAEHARDDFAAKNRAKVEEEKVLAAYRQEMDTGKKRLAAKQFDLAAESFNKALQIKKGDAEATAALRDVDKARADAKAADLKHEQDQRAEKVRQLVASARKALDAKDFTGAEKALGEAAKLSPDDKDVAKTNQDLAAAKKAAADSDKTAKQRKADYDLAMSAGKDAMTKKNYPGAVNSYKEALRLMPGDKDATDLLKAAEKAVADTQTADADKKKKADYEAAMKNGRTALAAKKYDDAIKAFTDAGKIMPGDKDAAALLKDAEKGRQDLLDAEAKRKQEDAKKKEDFNKFMAAGQAALTAKKYDDAIRDYTEALKLMPGDKDATKALDDAKKAQEAEKKKKQAADYNSAIQAGKTAFAMKKYDEAIKAFTDAGQIMPGDKDAATLLKEAQTAKTAALEAEAKHKAEEAKKKEDFAKLMNAGKDALTAKKYDDAIRDYTDALKLMPGDKDATKALEDAKKAADAAKTPPKPDPKEAYAKHMQAGAAADKQQKYGDAIAAYREALKAVPNDAKATAALKSAEFNSHMAEGKKLADAKKFADAAKEYEEATKIFPDNKEAKDALKRAKDGKP
jgi:tetratricopeptide (TPR) repeat protein